MMFDGGSRSLGTRAARLAAAWSAGRAGRVVASPRRRFSRSIAADKRVPPDRATPRAPSIRRPFPVEGPPSSDPVAPSARPEEVTGTPLRILALNWRCLRHPEAGGAERNLFEQARRWARDGHAVTIFCADPGRAHASARDENLDGVRVLRRGGRFSVYLHAALFLLARGDRFHRVLDVQNGIPFFAPLFTGTPSVLLVHHINARQWYTEFPRPLAAFGAFVESRVTPLIYRGHPIITVSTTTRDALVSLGVPVARVRVIHNGVEPSTGPLPVPAPGRRIAYVGRLKRYKRLDLLIGAVAALRSSFPDLHLDIAGDGDARAELEELVVRCGLRERVTFHGFVDEITKAQLLQRAMVFATPSMHEGWGLSVIEANAHGCPAVAYNVPGLCVAIRHGETGILADDDAGFRAALASLLAEPALRERLSTAARRWADRFSWESCANDTLEVLRAYDATPRRWGERAPDVALDALT